MPDPPVRKVSSIPKTSPGVARAPAVPAAAPSRTSSARSLKAEPKGDGKAESKVDIRTPSSKKAAAQESPQGTGLFFAPVHGDVVWAQVEAHFPYWPAVVFAADRLPEGHKISHHSKKVPVYLYGRNDFDLVPPAGLRDFTACPELAEQAVSEEASGLFAKALELATLDSSLPPESRLACYYHAHSDSDSKGDKDSVERLLGSRAPSKEEVSTTAKGMIPSASPSPIPGQSTWRVSPAPSPSRGGAFFPEDAPTAPSALIAPEELLEDVSLDTPIPKAEAVHLVSIKEEEQEELYSPCEMQLPTVIAHCPPTAANGQPLPLTEIMIEDDGSMPVPEAVLLAVTPPPDVDADGAPAAYAFTAADDAVDPPRPFSMPAGCAVDLFSAPPVPEEVLEEAPAAAVPAQTPSAGLFDALPLDTPIPAHTSALEVTQDLPRPTSKRIVPTNASLFPSSGDAPRKATSLFNAAPLATPPLTPTTSQAFDFPAAVPAVTKKVKVACSAGDVFGAPASSSSASPFMQPTDVPSPFLEASVQGKGKVKAMAAGDLFASSDVQSSSRPFDVSAVAATAPPPQAAPSAADLFGDPKPPSEITPLPLSRAHTEGVPIAAVPIVRAVSEGMDAQMPRPLSQGQGSGKRISGKAVMASSPFASASSPFDTPSTRTASGTASLFDVVPHSTPTGIKKKSATAQDIFNTVPAPAVVAGNDPFSPPPPPGVRRPVAVAPAPVPAVVVPVHVPAAPAAAKKVVLGGDGLPTPHGMVRPPAPVPTPVPAPVPAPAAAPASARREVVITAEKLAEPGIPLMPLAPPMHVPMTAPPVPTAMAMPPMAVPMAPRVLSPPSSMPCGPLPRYIRPTTSVVCFGLGQLLVAFPQTLTCPPTYTTAKLRTLQGARLQGVKKHSMLAVAGEEAFGKLLTANQVCKDPSAAGKLVASMSAGTGTGTGTGTGSPSEVLVWALLGLSLTSQGVLCGTPEGVQKVCELLLADHKEQAPGTDSYYEDIQTHLLRGAPQAAVDLALSRGDHTMALYVALAQTARSPDIQAAKPPSSQIPKSSDLASGSGPPSNTPSEVSVLDTVAAAYRESLPSSAMALHLFVNLTAGAAAGAAGRGGGGAAAQQLLFARGGLRGEQTFLSSWRSHAVMLLRYGGAAANELLVILAERLAREVADTAASTALLLCAGRGPEGLLLGCAGPDWLTRLRQAEVLECALTAPVPTAATSSSAASLLSWSRASTPAVGPGTGKPSRMRVSLLPYKVRLASLLAEYGLLPEAMAYVTDCRALIKDCAAPDSQNPRQPNTQNPKYPEVPKRLVAAVEDLADRLHPRGGDASAAQTATSSSSSTSSGVWGMFKGLVDGPDVTQVRAPVPVAGPVPVPGPGAGPMAVAVPVPGPKGSQMPPRPYSNSNSTAAPYSSSGAPPSPYGNMMAPAAPSSYGVPNKEGFVEVDLHTPSISYTSSAAPLPAGVPVPLPVSAPAAVHAASYPVHHPSRPTNPAALAAIAAAQAASSSSSSMGPTGPSGYTAGPSSCIAGPSFTGPGPSGPSAPSGYTAGPSGPPSSGAASGDWVVGMTPTATPPDSHPGHTPMMTVNTSTPPPSSTSTSSAVKPLTPSTSSSALSSVRKGIINWLYPEAKDTSEGIGGALEAYYDDKLKRWVFPGEDPAAVAPALGPPPSAPMSAPAAAMPSAMPPAGAGAGPPMSSMSAAPAPVDDMLAAMMAPPPRRGGPGSSSASLSLMGGPPTGGPPTGGPPMSAAAAPPSYRVFTPAPAPVAPVAAVVDASDGQDVMEGSG